MASLSRSKRPRSCSEIPPNVIRRREKEEEKQAVPASVFIDQLKAMYKKTQRGSKMPSLRYIVGNVIERLCDAANLLAIAEKDVRYEDGDVSVVDDDYEYYEDEAKDTLSDLRDYFDWYPGVFTKMVGVIDEAGWPNPELQLLVLKAIVSIDKSRDAVACLFYDGGHGTFVCNTNKKVTVPIIAKEMFKIVCVITELVDKFTSVPEWWSPASAVDPTVAAVPAG